MRRAAVFGLAVAGTAVARALRSRGVDVVLADDAPRPEHSRLADELGVELVDMGASGAVDRLLDGVDTLVPAPGVAPAHRVIAGALGAGIEVRTEIDIAQEWEAGRAGGPRPVVGVTGTDGKTTTTMLAGSLLRAAGVNAIEVGNTDIPFMAAIDSDVDAFVVECSSFRLRFTRNFRCDSSVWLNIAPDHLDWHGSYEDYARAKSRLWAHCRPGDVAVAPIGDPAILAAARASVARVVTFGGPGADYRREGDELVGPDGVIAAVSVLPRAMPHDVSNTLAAIALLDAPGLVQAGSAPVREGLARFRAPRHRIELVGVFAGTGWYDDSKATSPHAALAAIRGFDRVVLIAGGRNKDLDLAPMASEAGRMAGVVAIGDAAGLVESAFSGVCPVVRAGSMDEAVARASAMAAPGVDVLLSPGCTSFDWYSNYGERGDDFARAVRAHHGGEAR